MSSLMPDAYSVIFEEFDLNIKREERKEEPLLRQCPASLILDLHSALVAGTICILPTPLVASH